MATKREKEEQQRKRDETLIAAIAAALLIGASVQATATALVPKVGIPYKTLLLALTIAMSKPAKYTSGIPSAVATAESSRSEAAYRGSYVLAASRRLNGLSGERLSKALERERKYFDQHLHATRNRRDTAAQVDKAAQRYGDQLGWYAKMDSRTSAECKAANGKNFTVGKRPSIGYPGAVHPHCRCKAGKPHATSATVYNIKPDRRAA